MLNDPGGLAMTAEENQPFVFSTSIIPQPFYLSKYYFCWQPQPYCADKRVYNLSEKLSES